MPLEGSNSAILDSGLVLIGPNSAKHAWKTENGNQTQNLLMSPLLYLGHANLITYSTHLTYLRRLQKNFNDSHHSILVTITILYFE